MTSPLLGLADGIAMGERDRAERLLERLPSLRVSEVRAQISAAAWRSAEGRAWYEWLVPRLSDKARLLPAFSAEPELAAVVDDAVAALGDRFDHVEIPISADAETLESAAIRIWRHGKRTVLGGVDPSHIDLLRSLAEQGVMARVDAVGVRALSFASEPADGGWWMPMIRLKETLAEVAPDAELWITEAGYSTWRHDEFNQVKAFLEFLELPVGRIYWCAAEDRDAEADADLRLTGFGLWTTGGHPKLLARIWSKRGLDGVQEASRLVMGPAVRAPRPVLITGGAGFVGTNLADRLLCDGRPVVVFDSLDRPGTEDNLRWLREKHGEAVEVVVADVRDRQALRPFVRRASAIYHLAAQVAVTSSIVDPAHDFEVNAGGTFTVINLVSALADPPPLVFTSTNKVYGRLDDVRLMEEATRYVPEDPRIRARGVGEDRPLEFHSPYGCSKGAADQYVLDFARTRSLPAAVFRMSCIYGPHQCGNEDQGWVCHFIRSVLDGTPLTIYGDGKQVRDVLFIEDLMEAFLRMLRDPGALAGHAFNLGGGPANSLSLLELLEAVKSIHGRLPAVRFADWRPADQRYFVADSGRFRAATGWEPRVSVRDGLSKLYRWFRPRLPVMKRRKSS